MEWNEWNEWYAFIRMHSKHVRTTIKSLDSQTDEENKHAK